MKSIILLTIFNLLLCGCSCVGQKKTASLNIEIDSVYNKGQRDTIFFSLINYTKKTFLYQIGLEVKEDESWQLIYNDIFEFNRDIPVNRKIQKGATIPLYFLKSSVHKDYQTLYNNKLFRFVFQVYSVKPVTGIDKIPSKSFSLTWE